MSEEPKGSYFCCAKSEVNSLISKAEKEKQVILREFGQFYSGDIDILISPECHFNGWSISCNLTVNGKQILYYPFVDLCFLELNEMMLYKMMKERNSDDTKG